MMHYFVPFSSFLFFMSLSVFFFFFHFVTVISHSSFYPTNHSLLFFYIFAFVPMVFVLLCFTLPSFHLFPLASSFLFLSFFSLFTHTYSWLCSVCRLCDLMRVSCSAHRLSAVQQRRRHRPRGSNLSVCTVSGFPASPLLSLCPYLSLSLSLMLSPVFFFVCLFQKSMSLYKS